MGELGTTAAIGEGGSSVAGGVGPVETMLFSDMRVDRLRDNVWASDSGTSLLEGITRL